jgi:hypothetical protein
MPPPTRGCPAPETQADAERFVYSTALNPKQRIVKASKQPNLLSHGRGPSHAGTAQAHLLRIRPSVSSVRPGLQRVQGGLHPR